MRFQQITFNIADYGPLDEQLNKRIPLHWDIVHIEQPNNYTYVVLFDTKRS